MARARAQNADNDFAETLRRVSKDHERVVIRKSGKPVAAVIPIEDLRLLEQIEDEIDIAAAREALKEPGSISHEELKAKLGL
ncbi:MAG: type II toxin-antitoxin system Phd/YefM family antitoxin [Acidobacteria bacterium]|nr:type II toxin-antitoxin system Phd/YefM family antitoxin [Acidobacteriota bacterium]